MGYDGEINERLLANHELLCNIIRQNSNGPQLKVDLSKLEGIINKKIPDTLKKNAPEDFYELYTDFKSEYEKFRDFILYDKLIGKICRFCVDLNRRYDNVPKPLKMQSENNFLSIPVIKDGLSHVISVYCLYNFAHGGYADGYEVPNGKIPAEKMSICSFDNPYDAYAIAQKTNERFEQMMQTQYKKDVYKQKYASEIRRGVQPKESFDEFCQANPFLTRVMKPEENGVIKTVEHPQFTAWKKKHQYDNPNSLQTINLKRRARENVLCKEDNVDIRSGFRQNGAESR